MHRIAGFLAVEHGHDGIRAYNVQPNLIATERIAADMVRVRRGRWRASRGDWRSHRVDARQLQCVAQRLQR